ncbi:MAG: hypothetical protein H3C58_10915, partial [Fimbriimonadaceae bacterium]|nr:hypothetical protein [Fimbriimonadaceae bacterium]
MVHARLVAGIQGNPMPDVQGQLTVGESRREQRRGRTHHRVEVAGRNVAQRVQRRTREVVGELQLHLQRNGLAARCG